jgi:hypothetical protein
VQRVNSHVELSVVDTGIGIAASFLPLVFHRFCRQDGSATRSHGGLGPGLAICRQLVELHGGTIRAASAGEGQGSTSFLQLTLSLVQIEDETTREHPAVELADTEMVALPSLVGVHVFVVDDAPEARDLLERVLQDQGATVTAFSGTEDALAAPRASRPSVIVSDIGMPAWTAAR